MATYGSKHRPTRVSNRVNLYSTRKNSDEDLFQRIETLQDLEGVHGKRHLTLAQIFHAPSRCMGIAWAGEPPTDS